MAKAPDLEIQEKALMTVKETFDTYVELSDEYRSRMVDVYEAYSTFKTHQWERDWMTRFKVNKAYEVVEKVLPRIVAKNPRWIVTPRTDEFDANDKKATPQERLDKLDKLSFWSKWIQDYLSYIFDEYRLDEVLRLWAKNMLIYWNSYAKIKFKYEMSRIPEQINVDWETKTKVREKVIWEYPTIDVKSWTNIYVDPKFKTMSDMPAVIEITEWVRLSDLIRRDEFFNLDKLKNLPDQSLFESDRTHYINQIRQLAWIPVTDLESPIDKNSLAIKTFYWIFNETDDPEEERLMEITTVQDIFVIGMKEIAQIPFVDIKAFDDPELYFANWLVEPIISLQEELNFKKNSASEYINSSLNRTWIWSRNSWVNPADLVSKPWNVIPTSKDAATALNNLIELPQRPLTNDYFAEQNDIEKQIQWLTFTVDTAQPTSQQALTNTATWARIKFFESNAVMNELRKHFEKWMEELALKLLEATFENMDKNIVIKKLWDEWFWEINKELLRDAITRYSIKVEANSSSFTDLDARREDAIAFFNASLQAKWAGIDVDLEEAFKDVVGTFEKRDVNRFIKPVKTDIIEELTRSWLWVPWWQQIKQPETKSTQAAKTTEAVAEGWITEWL